jgi:hypothetical protein
MRSGTRVVWRGLMSGAIVAAAASAGCGWTARDEFYRSRAMTLHSQPGDGSELTWNPRTTPPSKTAGGEMASRWERERQ